MIDAAVSMFIVPVYFIGIIGIGEVHRTNAKKREHAFFTWTIVYAGLFLLWIARILVLILVP